MSAEASNPFDPQANSPQIDQSEADLDSIGVPIAARQANA
jgi:hypothetical protein